MNTVNRGVFVEAGLRDSVPRSWVYLPPSSNSTQLRAAAQGLGGTVRGPRGREEGWGLVQSRLGRIL